MSSTLGCKDIGIKNQSLWRKLNSFRFQLKLNLFTGKMLFAKISKMWIEEFFSEKSFCETNCFDTFFIPIVKIV